MELKVPRMCLRILVGVSSDTFPQHSLEPFHLYLFYILRLQWHWGGVDMGVLPLGTIWKSYSQARWPRLQEKLFTNVMQWVRGNEWSQNLGFLIPSQGSLSPNLLTLLVTATISPWWALCPQLSCWLMTLAQDWLEFSFLEWNLHRLLSKALDQGFKLSLRPWTGLAWALGWYNITMVTTGGYPTH